MVTLDAILAASIHERRRTNNIGFQEDFRVLNRAVNMRFRRKIDNNIRMFFLKQLVDCFPVSNICLHETEIRVIHHGRKRRQIARIRQLVKADNPIVRVLLEHMEDEVAANKTRAASNNNRHYASPLSTNVPDISHP